MTAKKWYRAVGAVAALTFVLAACGDDDNGEESDTTEESEEGSDEGSDDSSDEDDMSNEELSGSIGIDGSSTVGPLSEVAAELYMNENPGVEVTVAISGTSGGFEKFCNAETQFNDASRPIRDDEAALCEENGVAYDNITVANDALSLVVNNENPLECITVEQASQIWNLDSEVSTWGDVDGLDIPADFADTSIVLYGPGSDSGTFDYFTEAINGEEGQIRLDYTDIGEDDNAAVTGVVGDPGAMGYIPYSYYQEVGDQVKGLNIDDGSGNCVEPTLENVLDGSYTPLGRPLFVYASDVALEDPAALDFLQFYIDNQAEISELAGYVPLNDDQVAEQNDKIAQLSGGN
jgi:phosphate transport system substrate-binding protein